MILTERQNDGLTELLNIAFGRTAASLSKLTGRRVLLERPEVSLVAIGDLATALRPFLPGELAVVRQPFRGAITGDALLLLPRHGAIALTDLLTDGGGRGQLDDSAREVLTEVGNITLNACVGMLGNVLDVRLAFAVPSVEVDEVDEVVGTLASEEPRATYALVVSMAFRVKDTRVAGYVAIVLGIGSLRDLVERVETWEREA